MGWNPFWPITCAAADAKRTCSWAAVAGYEGRSGIPATQGYTAYICCSCNYPNVQLSVHDLRQVIRQIGRACHFRKADDEAGVCRRLVKQLRHGQPPEEGLPEWLRDVIAHGFAK